MNPLQQTNLDNEGSDADMRILGKAQFIALAAAAVVVFAGAPALAASNHAISGTVYSPCSGNGPWFTSSNARTKAGTGAVKAEFVDVNPGGLSFRLLGRSNQQFGVTQQWGPNETGIWRTFTSSMNNGTTFFNSFRQTSTSCGYHDYNFTGTEFY
jgi:hypothetical protein